MTNNSKIIELQDFRSALKKLDKAGYKVIGCGSAYRLENRNNDSDVAVLSKRELLQKALAA